jgi:sulfur relay (sulfurtransferase) complex TusBCD TusD component (DsrE family)
MRVASVFKTTGQTIDYVLGDMILPQLESDDHGADVAGMFFFHDNTYVLREGDPLGERLSEVAAERNILFMLCNQCATRRGLAEQVGEHESGRVRCAPRNVVDGATVGCFPDLYDTLDGAGVDQILTL